MRLDLAPRTVCARKEACVSVIALRGPRATSDEKCEFADAMFTEHDNFTSSRTPRLGITGIICISPGYYLFGQLLSFIYHYSSRTFQKKSSKSFEFLHIKLSRALHMLR